MSTSPSRPGRKHVWGMRLRILLGFAAVALAIALLVARTTKQSMVYYVTVSELLAEERAEADRDGLRVTGKVVPGTIDSRPMHLKFQMTDGSRAIPVEYRGVIPDTFGEEGEVVVEGCMRANGTFEASFLMAKCPSKYEASPDSEHPSDIPMTSDGNS